MIKKEEVFKIGCFTKPHGIKGEIGLATDYDITEQAGDPYLICEIEGIFVPFFIENLRNKSRTTLLVKLAILDTEDAVRFLAGKEAYSPVDAIDEDEHTVTAWDTFIGYELYDTTHGLLGKITALDDSTINILLQIDYKGQELLIPAVDEWILSIDHRKKRLTASIPEGLLDM
jgi:16S rRNA processing protein RimM